jgi:hypothetical protein
MELWIVTNIGPQIMLQIMCIVACFLGNATRNCVRLGSGRIFLLDNHVLHSVIELFALTTSSDLTSSLSQHSCTAILGEVSSALLGAQMSLALFGYELLHPARGLNGEHLIEGFHFSRCYAMNLFLPREHVSASNNYFVTVGTPQLDYHLRDNDFLGIAA